MKKSSIPTFLLFLTSLLLTSFTTVFGQCVDYPVFYDRKFRTPSTCTTVKEQNTNHNLGKAFDADPSTNSTDTKNMIIINFTCDANDTKEHCTKAKYAFETASRIISSTISLNTPIYVNASFVNLCETFISCDPTKPGPLGAAGPSRFIPIEDDDGVTRLYPQALVKQLQLPTHPAYAKFDIIAGFNSASDRFWFENDPQPPTNEQIDFVLVIVHEMIHGLGFISSWDDYSGNISTEAITPFPGFILSSQDSNTSNPINGPITFTGFQEFIFDRFLVFTKDGQSVSSVTSQINTFAGGIDAKAQFANASEFLSKFKNSSQYNIAKDMLVKASTSGSMSFLPHITNGANESYLIETGLVPYMRGSSMSHLDFMTFSNTTDFLMRFKAPRGVPLNDLTAANGNNTIYTNPIGPEIIEILKTLGYKTINNSSNVNQKISNTGSSNSYSPTSNLYNSSSNKMRSTISSIIISLVLLIILEWDAVSYQII